MQNIIEPFRRYGLPVIGGGALFGSFLKGIESTRLSFMSVDQAASRAESDISCYFGIIAILCGIGYFGLRPHSEANPEEPL